MFNNVISKSTIIKHFSNISNIPSEYSLITSYTYFYYKNYNDFKPEVNDEIIQLKNKNQKLIKMICKDFEENNPSSIDFNAIENFLNNNPSIISEQIKYLIKEQKKTVREYWENENENRNYLYSPDSAVKDFETFSIFYWPLSFLNDVLLFDSKESIVNDELDYIYYYVLLLNGIK